MVNLRNGYIESALQPADYAFDNAALFFERSNTVEMQIGCHYPIIIYRWHLYNSTAALTAFYRDIILYLRKFCKALIFL